MIDAKSLEDAAKKVCEKLPEGFKSAKSGLEESVKSALKSVIEKLDLVTREEFDAQLKVLKRCEKKIKDLEKQLKS